MLRFYVKLENYYIQIVLMVYCIVIQTAVRDESVDWLM